MLYKKLFVTENDIGMARTNWMQISEMNCPVISARTSIEQKLLQKENCYSGRTEVRY